MPLSAGRLIASTLLAGAIILMAFVGYARWPWAAWRSFTAAFVQADGRVVDPDSHGNTTSEGQAYALFFALIADDRGHFEQILQWTQNNLAGGDFAQHLPAWSWGKNEAGEWAVLDGNSASDADLWLAYDLLQAGRIWKLPEYTALAHAVLDQISHHEVTAIPGGQVLLPGAQGFRADDGSLRLNPSYTPGFILQALASADAAGPWLSIRDTSNRLLGQLLKRGVAPDWYRVDAQGVPGVDPKSGATGSYDAIRVYLWAGVTARGTEMPLLGLLTPFSTLLETLGSPPQRADSVTGEASGEGPVGFSSALLPYLSALHRPDLIQAQLARINAQRAQKLPLRYYDEALRLFGEGWIHNRYRIGAEGELQPRWEITCCSV